MAELTVQQMDWSPLAKLPEVYEAAQRKYALKDLGRRVASGEAGDREIAAALLGMGDITNGAAFLKLSASRDASKDFYGRLNSMGTEAGAGVPRSLADLGSQPQLPMTLPLPAGQQGPPAPNWGNAIAATESGGNYKAVGRPTASGDRALGKYQIMMSNLGDWSEEALGRRLTPQEFLNDPAAQDAIFKHRFGQYVRETGNPDDAASKWFTGKPLVEGANRRDANGMSGTEYVSRFNQNLERGYADNGKLLPDSRVRVADVSGSIVPEVSGAPQSAQQAQPDAAGGLRITPQMRTLLGALSNPNLPKAEREIAGKLFEHMMRSSDLPDQAKQYYIAKSQGFPGTFMDYQLALKRAGATTINTAEGMDSAQTKARIEVDKHAVADLSKRVVAGRGAIPLLTRMMAINDKTPGGWAGQVAPYIAKAATSFGVEVPEGASNAELFAAMSRQFIPNIRDPGSTSNYEQSLYLQAVPSLSQSPEGRAKIANMMKAQIERNAEVLRIYRQYIGKPELDQKLADLDAKPMFSPEDRRYLESVSGGKGPQNSHSLPRAASPDDVQKLGLKSGDRFIDDAGNTRRVP